MEEWGGEVGDAPRNEDFVGDLDLGQRPPAELYDLVLLNAVELGEGALGTVDAEEEVLLALFTWLAVKLELVTAVPDVK